MPLLLYNFYLLIFTIFISLWVQNDWVASLFHKERNYPDSSHHQTKNKLFKIFTSFDIYADIFQNLSTRNTRWWPGQLYFCIRKSLRSHILWFLWKGFGYRWLKSWLATAFPSRCRWGCGWCSHWERFSCEREWFKTRQKKTKDIK